MEKTNDRRKGIGGTDVSALLGMNPWRTPLDVFLEKTGQAPEREDTEEFWWGRELEPVIAKRYEMETGFELLRPPDFLSPIFHPKYPFIMGSPDALIIGKQTGIMRAQIDAGVEFKTSGQPQEWGEPGTDEVPEHYHLQCDFYMGLTGAQWWDIAVLLMGFKREFRIYRIHRDQELIDFLIGEAELFWLNHVIPNIPPELDGSESARQYLNRLYPKDRSIMFEPTDPDILITVGKYAHARKQIANWNEQAAVLEMRLKSFIGDAAGMRGEWGKITWKSGKNGTRRFYPQFKGV